MLARKKRAVRYVRLDNLGMCIVLPSRREESCENSLCFCSHPRSRTASRISSFLKSVSSRPLLFPAVLTCLRPLKTLPRTVHRFKYVPRTALCDVRTYREGEKNDVVRFVNTTCPIVPRDLSDGAREGFCRRGRRFPWLAYRLRPRWSRPLHSNLW